MFIEGKAIPQTPEQLMRSRYTAFTQANVEYIVQTMHEKACEDFDAENTRQWAKQVQWVGLEIIQAPAVTTTQKGIVEFIASYRQQGQLQNIREVSEFMHDGERWYYTGGQGEAIKQTPRTANKIGRNDPCPCGSDKKYKKCCGI
jgi:SEC-C motif-containing protein